MTWRVLFFCNAQRMPRIRWKPVDLAWKPGRISVAPEIAWSEYSSPFIVVKTIGSSSS